MNIEAQETKHLLSNTDEWSAPADGLQGRLLAYRKPNVNGTQVIGVDVELKNVKLAPLAVQNDPAAVDVEVLNVHGKPVPQAPATRSGPVPFPQWGVIPRDSYLRFPIESHTVGVPRNGGALLAFSDKVWVLKKGEYILQGAYTLRRSLKDAPENAWAGRVKLPPLKIRVTQ